MSFFPMPHLNLYVCEIEITQQTINSYTAITLGNILRDNGGLISLSNATDIVIPPNCEAFIRANIVSDSATTSNNQTVASFTDTSGVSLANQASANVICRSSGGQWFTGMEIFLLIFSSGSNQTIQLRANQASTTPIIINYNSAATYIPNSTITIMYTDA